MTCTFPAVLFSMVIGHIKNSAMLVSCFDEYPQKQQHQLIYNTYNWPHRVFFYCEKKGIVHWSETRQDRIANVSEKGTLRPTDVQNHTKVAQVGKNFRKTGQERVDERFFEQVCLGFWNFSFTLRQWTEERSDKKIYSFYGREKRQEGKTRRTYRHSKSHITHVGKTWDKMCKNYKKTCGTWYN